MAVTTNLVMELGNGFQRDDESRLTSVDFRLSTPLGVPSIFVVVELSSESPLRLSVMSISVVGLE